MLIYRCSEGHLFKLSLARRALSVHLGTSKYGKCPVDGRWGKIQLVDRHDLTEAEIEGALDVGR